MHWASFKQRSGSQGFNSISQFLPLYGTLQLQSYRPIRSMHDPWMQGLESHSLMLVSQRWPERTRTIVTDNNTTFNSLRPRQNGRHFPDAIFRWIFLNENVWILIKISLKFVSKGLINNIPALVQLMVGAKPLSEPIMVSLLMHISVTQPQWVKNFFDLQKCF